MPYDLTLLAEVYSQAGRIEDGLAALAEALTLVNRTGERNYEAEIHRLRGELLLARPIPVEREAETCFAQALDVARSQSAKSLELRAATSLARFGQRPGKRGEARALLAEVHGWFTEGFDTRDLTEARALLDALS